MLRQRLVPTGSRAPASANLDVPVDVLQRLLLAAGPFSFGLLKCREPLRKLHSLGVPCTVVDSKGRTMLHWAAFTDESELVATLLDGCADVDLQDQEGNTALHLAASNNATGVLKKLLEHGACRSIRNNERCLAHQVFNASSYTRDMILQTPIWIWAPWRHSSGPVRLRKVVKTLMLLSRFGTDTPWIHLPRELIYEIVVFVSM